MGDITKDFSVYEIECRCGCGLKKISSRLMSMAQLVRNYCGFCLTVNSGCRCPKHNSSKAVGGKKNSAHLPDKVTGECKALDIRFRDGAQLMKIIAGAIKAGFKRIGINFALKFVHLDIDDTKPQNTIFHY